MKLKTVILIEMIKHEILKKIEMLLAIMIEYQKSLIKINY